jgi:hypothetical protein
MYMLEVLQFCRAGGGRSVLQGGHRGLLHWRVIAERAVHVFEHRIGLRRRKGKAQQEEEEEEGWEGRWFAHGNRLEG